MGRSQPWCVQEFSNGESHGAHVLDTSLLDTEGSIPSVTSVDERVLSARRRIRDILRSSRRGPNALLERFNKFRFLFSKHEVGRMRDFVAGDHRLRDFDKEIARLAKIKDEVEATCADVEVFDMVEVRTGKFKALLRKQAQGMISMVTEELARRMSSMCAAMNKEYTNISQVLQQAPDNTQQLVELNAFSVRSIADLARLSTSFSGRDGVVKHVMLLAKWGHAVKVSDTFVLKETVEWPEKIRKEMDHAASMLEVAKARMLVKLETDVKDFLAETNQVILAVRNLRREASLIAPKVLELQTRCHELRTLLNTALHDAGELNVQQQRLGVEESDLKGPVYKAMLELDPFERLWDTVEEYQRKYVIATHCIAAAALCSDLLVASGIMRGTRVR